VDVEERIERLENKIDKLYNNCTTMFLYSGLDRRQRIELMEYIIDSSGRMADGELISRDEFQAGIYKIVPSQEDNEFFCEMLTRYFVWNEPWDILFRTFYEDIKGC